MLQNLYKDIYFISPEILMVFGIFAALLLGTFTKSHSFKVAANIILITFIISICQIVHLDNEYMLLFNGSLLINKFTQFGKVIVISCNFIVLLAIVYFESKGKKPNFEISVLIALTTLGMCLLISSNSLLSFYLGLELFSLGLYILIATGKHGYRAIEASLKYFILGAISSGIFLFGASLIYGYTGALTFDEISFVYKSNYCAVLYTKPQNLILVIGFVLVIITAMFKLSLFPFYNWAPDVYEGSHSTITMLLASSAKFAVLIIFLRMLFGSFFVIKEQLQQILIIVAMMSLLFGNIAAIVQQNIKRIIAYSSIGHMGFILLSVVTYTTKHLEFTIFYALTYITLIITFFALIIVLNKIPEFDGRLKSLYVLSKRNAFVAFAFAIVIFSMAGIPPLAGFFAKFYILMELFENKLYYLAIIAFVSMIIGAFYYLNIIRYIYFEKILEEDQHKKPIKLNIIESTVITAGLAFNILYILFPSYVLDLIRSYVVYIK
jgi:NADH-quinone oxidoreductase subunit N